MTEWDQQPIDALKEGARQAVFLHWRKSCKHLQRKETPVGNLHHCRHPSRNRNYENQLPNCFLSECPLLQEKVESKAEDIARNTWKYLTEFGIV